MREEILKKNTYIFGSIHVRRNFGVSSYIHTYIHTYMYICTTQSSNQAKADSEDMMKTDSTNYKLIQMQKNNTHTQTLINKKYRKYAT